MYPFYADAHSDTFFHVALWDGDLFTGHNTQHVTYHAMRQVGQRLQLCALWTPARYSGQEAEDFAANIFDHLDLAVRSHPEAFTKVRHAHQLKRLVENPDGPVALIPWIESGVSFRGSLEVFDRFADRGVKGVGLVWNYGNEIADGCNVPEPRRGLTDFGRDLIRRMESRRVLVDLAHCPEPAFWDVIEHARRPVVVSHCGMRALKPMTRNLSDRMAKAVAVSGGFIGIDFFPAHLDRHHGQPCARRPGLEALAAHVVRAINVCGQDNVVLGGDFDGFEDAMEGLEHLSDVPNIPEALMQAGLTERQVEKVMGRNLVERLLELW